MVEVLVIVAIVLVLAAVLLPILAAAKRSASRINCVSNLKQVQLAFRIWEGDHNNEYPMEVSVTNGGAMETVVTGEVVNCFYVMSNELSTPKVLVCPVESDLGKIAATNFLNDFNNSHISYFVGVDADGAYPQRIMSGDDNFTIGGMPIGSGLREFSTNAPVAWDSNRHDYVVRIPAVRIPLRHDYCGNIGYADGSVAPDFDTGLRLDFVRTGLATNRLAIP